MTRDGTKKYEYEPLIIDDNNWAHKTRLLQLEPASDHRAPLLFSLKEVDVEAAEHTYEAISYTWGEPVFCKEIQSLECGRYLKITESLDVTLRKFRLPHTVRYLWVDAVCINQDDDQEKTEQIPLMSDIYEKAQHVLVWLGGGEDQEKVMNFLRMISRLRRNREKIESVFENTLADSQLDLESFFTLPYFSRIWIIQEIVTNCDVELFCGNSHISWTRFVIALEVLNKSKIDSVDRALLSTKHISHEIISSLSNLWRLHASSVHLENRYIDDQHSTLLALLDSFNTSQCADPRDRLYALYGLAVDVPGVSCGRNKRDDSCTNTSYLRQRASLYKKHGPRFGLIRRGGRKAASLILNYNIPAEIIYEHYTISALQTPDILPILVAAAARKGQRRLQNLPSWVPDWTIAKEPKIQKLLMGVTGDEKVHIGEVGMITIDIDVISYDTIEIPTIKRVFPSSKALHRNSTVKHHEHCDTSWLGWASSLKAQKEMGLDDLLLFQSRLQSCLACTLELWEPVATGQLDHETTIPDTTFSDVDRATEAVLCFAQTYYSFCAKTRIPKTPYNGKLSDQNATTQTREPFIYNGIANVQVEEGDRVIIPATWAYWKDETDYQDNTGPGGQSPSHSGSDAQDAPSSSTELGFQSCFRALILRAADNSEGEGSSFSIAGYAWVASSQKEMQDDTTSIQEIKGENSMAQHRISISLV